MRIRSWRRWLCGSIAVRLLLPTVALILVGLLLLTASPAAADEDQPPQELPGPVIDLTLTPHADRVVVSWRAPQTGGAVNGYIVHLRPEDGQRGSGTTKRPKAKKTKVTFNKIEPGTTYLVWARARNAAGKGERVHARVTTPAASPEQQLKREDQRQPEPEPQPKDTVAPGQDGAQTGEKPIRQVWYGVRWETPEPSTEPALVSNFGQARNFFDFPTNNYVHSQGFTTGESESVLESVSASIRTVLNVAHIATIRAEIWSAAAGGEPDQKLVELIVPDGMGEGGDVVFAAPPNTVLAARTPYHFVLYTTGRVDLRVVATSSVDEDAWSEVGWIIADASHHIRAQTPEGGSWVEQSSEGVMLIRLDGAVAE